MTDRTRKQTSTSRARRAMKPAVGDVDAYIAAAPLAARPLLRELRALVRAAAPKAEEKISYGMPYYTYLGGLVYFGGHTNHIGFYPAGYAAKYPQLKKYMAGPGTIRFPLDSPLPTAEITKLVEARVKENEARARSGSKAGSARA